MVRNIDEDINILSITPNIIGIGQETTPVIIKGNNFIQGMTLQIGDTAVGYTLLNKSTVVFKYSNIKSKYIYNNC